MEEDALRVRWRALAHTDAGFDDLATRYREPGRRYHTLEHLAEVLDAVDQLAPAADDAAAVRLAAWFHDAVYDPRRPDNEAASAALVDVTLPTLSRTTCAEARRLILATASHEVAAGDGNGAVLIDADLAILGADPARYDRYATDVRAEYAHLPDDVWRAGRAAVLASFLDRPRIFHTDAGRSRWEARARGNLRRELARLADVGADLENAGRFDVRE